MNVFLKRVQIQICKSVLVDKSRRTELLVTSQSVVLWGFLCFFFWDQALGALLSCVVLACLVSSRE